MLDSEDRVYSEAAHGTNWASGNLAFVAASIVLLLVGFTEEIPTRGLLATGFRSRFGEGCMRFISTAQIALPVPLKSANGQELGPQEIRP